MAPSNNPLKLLTWLKSTNETIDENHSSKVMLQYLHAARWIPAAVSPFMNVSASLRAGTDMLNRQELRPGIGEGDLVNFQLFSAFCPEIQQVLKAFDGNTDLLKLFSEKISAAANSARADDTSSCRKATADYIFASAESRLLEKKSERGWNNAYTARALCPLKYLSEFDDNQELFMVRVRTGTIKIKASQWPSFLYPRDAQYDPDNIDAGLFEGEIFLQFLRNIYTGPTSAADGIRRAGKPSKAEIHGMDRVFGRCVAYAAVQAYFSLSAIEQWMSSLREGYFDLNDFFNNCVDVFEVDPKDPWVVHTLDSLTRGLPSLKREYKRKRKSDVLSISSDESDEDEVNAIYVQREARRKARSLGHVQSTVHSRSVTVSDAIPNTRNNPSAQRSQGRSTTGAHQAVSRAASMSDSSELTEDESEDDREER